jgi:hypothetical protein
MHQLHHTATILQISDDEYAWCLTVNVKHTLKDGPAATFKTQADAAKNAGEINGYRIEPLVVDVRDQHAQAIVDREEARARAERLSAFQAEPDKIGHLVKEHGLSVDFKLGDGVWEVTVRGNDLKGIPREVVLTDVMDKDITSMVADAVRTFCGQMGLTE